MDNKEFDFDEQAKSMELDFDKKLREANIRREDEDLSFQRKRQSLFDFDEIEARKEQRQIDKMREMTELASRKRQEELEQKSNIAMRNMKMMMEAKRAAKQDELQHEKDLLKAKFEAEERRMQTQKEMTAEQIMAVQIREMDAGAQVKFAESFSAGKNAEREREMADEKAKMSERMMQQMMEMTKMGFQANANVATGRIEVLSENNQPISSIQTPSTEPEQTKSIRLNTAWLRQHGYEGSFNELAGQLANMGGSISQDFDDHGNPVIVVEQLSDAQVMELVMRSGVSF